MAVLVDTSVWIDYFRSGQQSAELSYFIIAQNAKETLINSPEQDEMQGGWSARNETY